MNLIPPCFNKCSIVINDFIKSKDNKIYSAIMQNTKKYQDKYQNKFFEFVIKKDMTGIIRIFREIIKTNNFKTDLLLLFDNIYEIDKKNMNDIDIIIDCFLNNCDKDGIDFMCEIFGLLCDLLNIINDNDINNKLNFIRNRIIEIIKEKGKKMEEYRNKMIKQEKKVNSEEKKSKKEKVASKENKGKKEKVTSKENKGKKVASKENKVKKVNSKNKVKKSKK